MAAWVTAVEKWVIVCEQGTSRPHLTSSCHSRKIENDSEFHVQHFISLLNYTCRPKSQSPSMSPRGIICGMIIKYVGTRLLDQWDARILPGMGEIILAMRTDPLEAMKSPSHRVPEEKIWTWFLPWCQKDLIWWVAWQVSEWQCHDPSPISRHKLTQWLGPDIDTRVQSPGGWSWQNTARVQGRHYSQNGHVLLKPKQVLGKELSFSEVPSFQL